MEGDRIEPERGSLINVRYYLQEFDCPSSVQSPKILN
jgi:hypothetical protein